jgi:FlaA1/EpsC-like NDP-sugar epimerase
MPNLARKKSARSPRLTQLRERLISMPRSTKRLLTLLVDFCSGLMAAGVSILATTPYLDGKSTFPWESLFLAGALMVPVFSAFGFYRIVIRFLRSPAIVSIVARMSVLAGLMLLLSFFSPRLGFELGTAAMFWAFGILSVAGSRFIVRDFLHRPTGRTERAIIYGAGHSGARLADLLNSSGDCLPVAFVDDASALHGSVVAGLRVHAPEQLLQVAEEQDATRVLLAMPSASRKRRAEVLKQLENTSLHVQSVPDLHDLLSGKARFDELREVEVEDLLGRDPVPPRQDLIAACVRGRSVMVTGAGGSIGSELCRQVVKLAPRRLVLVDHAEPALYAIDQELQHAIAALDVDIEIVPILTSVTESDYLEQTIRAFDVRTVYHAAAYKHVPLVEYNMAAGIRNNVIGTLRAAEAAERAGVENFVLVSTDKAVNPTNVMGATKRFAEMILQGMVDRGSRMRICMVRFGNVLDSSGSVVPLFREQIRAGGPVTVTHPEIVRYFMTIPEAAQLVIQAGAMGQSGEVFLLDMGEPVKIIDLARRMILLAGLEVRDADNPDGDIEIVYTGLRPAEKLYEELLISGNAIGTEHPRIWKAEEGFLPWSETNNAIESISKALLANDCEAMRAVLLGAVREYTPPTALSDRVYLAALQAQRRAERTIVELPKRS